MVIQLKKKKKKNETDSSDLCLANDGCQNIVLHAQKRGRKPLGWGLPALSPKISGSEEVSALQSHFKDPTPKDAQFERT